jgi:hypothetical protein
MRTNLLFIFMFLCFSFAGNAKDKIITIGKDTIDCKIKKITKKTIFFDQFTKNTKMSGKIPTAEVSDYIIDSKSIVDKQFGKTFQEKLQRIRIGLGGGLGYRYVSSKTAEEQLVNNGFTEAESHSYYNGLKFGRLASADVTYLFSPTWGLGLKYKFFNNSSSQKGFIDPHDQLNLYYGKVSENMFVNFVGVSYYAQTWLGVQNRLKFNSSVSIGMASYRDESSILYTNVLITGSSIATDCSIGVEYFLRKNFSLGIDLSAFFSTMKEYKLTDKTSTTTTKLNADEYDNISRLDLSIGAKIYF